MGSDTEARSIIWCARTPHHSPLSVGEVVQLIEQVASTDHLFVFVDTVSWSADHPGRQQVALHLQHISSVSVAREG